MATIQGIILLNSSSAALQIVNQKTGEKIEKVMRDFGESDINSPIFTTEIMRRALAQVHKFQQLLRDYAVKEVTLYGSETLSQMKNAVYFADQIETATGLKIQWLNGNQESFYRQLALRQAYQQQKVSATDGQFLFWA